MAKPGLLAGHVAVVQRHEAGLPGQDSVHQMRVAVRRLRMVLRLLQLRGLDPGAKRLQDALGEVRDAQLQSDWLRGRDTGLRRIQQARMRRAKEGLRRELSRWRSQTLPALLDAAVGDPAPSPHRLSKLFRNRVRRLRDRLERARLHPTPATIHQARISAKQVRYLVEAAEDLLPKKVVRLHADLKALHVSLGELHDLDVRIALVKRRPALLREQKETRARLGRIASAQLARWHKQHLIERVDARLH